MSMNIRRTCSFGQAPKFETEDVTPEEQNMEVHLRGLRKFLLPMAGLTAKMRAAMR
jgi:hypothetical protein